MTNCTAKVRMLCVLFCAGIKTPGGQNRRGRCRGAQKGVSMTGELGKLAVPAAGAAAAAAGLLYLRSEYEKEHFVTECYEIRSPKIHQPKRLVFLTDLHEKSFSRDNRLLREELSRIDPDFVLAGGDLVTCPKDREEYAVSLSLMRFLAERWPVYYAPGNHEDRMRTRNTDYFSELEKAGVTFLENESAEAAEDIRITGVRLDHVYYRTRFRIPVLSPGYLKETVGEADMERFQILLLHSPQFFEDCAAWGADLTLSGHFHGGTIRLPYLGGLMTPQYQFFRRECAGRFEKDGKTMIVGRGLGTHSVNIRLNDRPQIVVVNLLPDGTKKE